MIRRPLFLGTLGFCGAILISYFLGKAAALGVLGLLVFAWWQWRQAGDPAGSNGVHAIRMQRQKLRKHGTAILMVFYVVSLVNVQLYELQRDPFAELEETGGVITTTATGTVLNSSIRTSGSGDEYLQMTVWVQQIGEQEVPRRWYERPVRLLVKQYPDRGIDFSDLTPASPGTQLCITGKVELPPGRRNPNCFDYQLYLKTIGIERVMTAQTIHIKEESHSLQGWLFQQKEQYLHQLKGTAGESAAGLMRGILFGEKTEIEEDTLEEFQRNGTAHILAVSGLHIGILYGVLGKLWRGKKGWLYFWMVTMVLIGYSFLASFSPSVVRASVMIVLHLYAASEVRSWLGFLCSTSYDPAEKSHAAVPYRAADVVSCSSDTFCCGAFFSKVLSRYIFVQRCGAARTFAVHSLCVQLCVFSCGVHQCTDHFPGGVSGSAWDRRICPEPDLAGTDCGINRNHGTGYRRIVWIADKLQQYDLYQRCHII